MFVYLCMVWAIEWVNCGCNKQNTFSGVAQKIKIHGVWACVCVLLEKLSTKQWRKCLAIFEGTTSVKLKTLVARSAVMFVFENGTHKPNVILIHFSSFWRHGHQWRPFINKSFQWNCFFRGHLAKSVDI